MIRKVLDEFKTEKAEELKWRLKSLTLTSRSFQKLSDYKEEKKQEKWKENVWKKQTDLK